MSGDDVVQFIHQFRSFESNMGSSLLKIFDFKHLVLVTVTPSVIVNVIA
ncbi:Uncharacterised protein [Salmonella enterica subsp. enterica serovar Bovismorbificans]|uniref:Uncharacterized protein n=1 Tax=Salmonella enterica subsp. enterica serovar Bovismorbificans TaxID=58097 RepID=A0A655EMD4_SALET|nr:Uncharacterised protein [Salmonella enterica subsp. enterica serovar Bovismorbificans]